MPGRWWDWRGAARPAVSAEFEHALMREVMRTELIRVKALIATVVVLGTVLTTVYLARPRCRAALLARPSQAAAFPDRPGPVRPVRAVGLLRHQPLSETRSRRAGVPALYRRLHRDQHSDGCAGLAHGKHGTQRARSATWCRSPISSSSFSRRCGSISGSRPSPDLSLPSSCLRWRCSIIRSATAIPRRSSGTMRRAAW